MQGKKHRKFRSQLHQYELHFGLRPPYNVLVDGNFLALSRKIDLELDKKLAKVFRAKVFLCTTRCIKEELRRLGQVTAAAYSACQRFKFLKCNHDMIVEPSMCILSHVGKTNMGNLLVASQDNELLEDLGKNGRTPRIRFVNGNVLDVVKMSEEGTQMIEKLDKKKYLPTPDEMKAVQAVNKEVKEQERKDQIEKIRRAAQLLGEKLKKRARGPNPLSVPKKRLKTEIISGQNSGPGEEN
jgi:U3 small nucleolar RNA-associated protein 23